jgi:hypothetical protein
VQMTVPAEKCMFVAAIGVPIVRNYLSMNNLSWSNSKCCTPNV